MKTCALFPLLLFLMFLWSNTFARVHGLYEMPTGMQIPPQYEAAKNLTALYTNDLQWSILSRNDMYLTHSATAIPFFNTYLSYYGRNRFGTHNGPDFQLQKLLFTKVFNQAGISAGVGYDFNRVRDSHYTYYYGIITHDDFGNPIKEELHGRLTLNAYDENRYYTNLNTLLSLGKNRKLLFATDLLLATQKGFKYFEQFDESSKSSKYNTSRISYYDLHDQAYSYDYYLGVIYWRHLRSRRNRKFSLAYNLSWNHSHQHSEPDYLAGIRPYFEGVSPDLGTTIQYTGVDNYQNTIMLELSVADLFPDMVTGQRPLLWGLLHFQFALDKLSIALAGEYNVTDETHINRWQRPQGIFWGKTKHTCTDSPVSLVLDHAFRFFLFKHLYAKVEYYSTKSVTYGQDFIAAELDQRIATSFGAQFVINNLFLLEIKHGFYHVNFGLSLYSDRTDYTNRWHWGKRNDPGILLRIAMLQ